jgi:hypothetical protein
VAVLADPSLRARLPEDATGAAAKLAALARGDALVTAALAWAALALQGLALALAAALQPDGDRDAEAPPESEEEAWATIEAAAIARGMPRAPSTLRAPLLPGHAARGARADASRAAEDEWSQRMCVIARARGVHIDVRIGFPPLRADVAPLVSLSQARALQLGHLHAGVQLAARRAPAAAAAARAAGG